MRQHAHALSGSAGKGGGGRGVGLLLQLLLLLLELVQRAHAMVPVEGVLGLRVDLEAVQQRRVARHEARPALQHELVRVRGHVLDRQRHIVPLARALGQLQHARAHAQLAGDVLAAGMARQHAHTSQHVHVW